MRIVEWVLVNDMRQVRTAPLLPVWDSSLPLLFKLHALSFIISVHCQWK